MPLKAPTRPSVDAIRVLRHIALYGSFGTAAGATAYVLEDQRRQICKLKKIVENGRKLNEFKRHQHTARGSPSGDKSLDFNAFIQVLESTGHLVKEPVSQTETDDEFHYHFRKRKCTTSEAVQVGQHSSRKGHPDKRQPRVADQPFVNLPSQSSPPVVSSGPGPSSTPSSQQPHSFLGNSSVTDRRHPFHKLNHDSLESDVFDKRSQASSRLPTEIDVFGKLAARPAERSQASSHLPTETDVFDKRSQASSLLPTETDVFDKRSQASSRLPPEIENGNTFVHTVQSTHHELIRKISPKESSEHQIAGLTTIFHASSRMLGGAVLLQNDATLWEQKDLHGGDICEDPLLPKWSLRPELPPDVVSSAWQPSRLRLQDRMKEVSDYLARVIAFQYNVLRLLDRLKARLYLRIVRRRTIYSLNGLVEIYSDVARFVFDLELRLIEARFKHDCATTTPDDRLFGVPADRKSQETRAQPTHSSRLSREDHFEHTRGRVGQLEQECEEASTFPKPRFWLADTWSSGDSLTPSAEDHSSSAQSILGPNPLLEGRIEPVPIAAIPHSSNAQASLIRSTWFRTRDLKQVDALFDTLLSSASIADRSLDTQVHNARVWALIQARAYAQASACLKSAFILGRVHPDARTLDLMMTVAAVRHDWTLVEDIQKTLEDFRNPNKPSKSHLFRTIFSQYCAESKPPRIAQFVWTITQRLGIQYVSHDLQLILSECVKAGDIEKAIALAYFVREHGSQVQITARTVHKAFRSYTKRHRPTGFILLQLLEQLKTINPTLLSKELVALVWVILANQLRQHAQTGRGYRHVAYHDHHRRDFHCAIPYLRTLYAESRSLRKETPRKIPPGLVKAEMNSALSTGNFAAAVRIYDQHISTGIRGRPDMLNLCVYASEKMGQREKTNALLEQAQVAGENTTCANKILLLGLIKSKDIADPHVLERLVFDFYERGERQTGKIEHDMMTAAASNLLNRTVTSDGVSNYVHALNILKRAYLTYAEREPFRIAQWTVFFQAYSRTGNWGGIKWVTENILARHVKIDIYFFKMLWIEKMRWLQSMKESEQVEVARRAFFRIRNRLRRQYQGNRWWVAEIGKKMVQVLAKLQNEFAGGEVERATLQATVRPFEDYVQEENRPEMKLPCASRWTRYSPAVRDWPSARLPPPSTTCTRFLIPMRNQHKNRNRDRDEESKPASAPPTMEEEAELPDGEFCDPAPMVAHEWT